MKHFTFCAMLLALLTIAGCNPVTYDVFATICGTVVDSETMEPIEGVSVVLSPSGKNKVTKAVCELIVAFLFLQSKMPFFYQRATECLPLLYQATFLKQNRE